MRFGCLHSIDVPIVTLNPSKEVEAADKVNQVNNFRDEARLNVFDPIRASNLVSNVDGTTQPDTLATIEPSLVSERLPMGQKVSKTIVGELEVAAMPDKSHRFLVGQRTIIRIRLVT